MQNGTFLQTERLHNSQNALHESAPGRAMAAKRTPTLQHRATLDPFDVVVGRLHALGDREYPQRRVQREQALAETAWSSDHDSAVARDAAWPIANVA